MTYSNEALSNQEVIDFSNKIINWTPRINGGTAEQFTAASQFHLAIIDNFMRLYGEQLKELDAHNYDQLSEPWGE